jgi:hypothetical protein
MSLEGRGGHAALGGIIEGMLSRVLDRTGELANRSEESRQRLGLRLTWSWCQAQKGESSVSEPTGGQRLIGITPIYVCTQCSSLYIHRKIT